MNRMRFCLWGCLAVGLLLFIQNNIWGHPHPYFLPAVIILLGLYGLLCAYLAIRGMNRHLRHFASLSELEAEKKRFYPPVEGLDVVDYCRELSAWLTRLNKKQSETASVQPEKHFKERVRSLVDTQNQAERAHVDIDLPSIGDLGNLTDLAEQSSPGVVGLNVTISFLLILGILGTLQGIHGNMSDTDSIQDLSELGPALLPSAFAVGITVILMVTKGIYQYKRSHYMADLNRFTLLHLIPHLQRDGNDDEVMEQVESGAEGFFDAVTYVAGFADAAEQSKNRLVEEVDSAKALLDRLGSLKSQLEQRVGAEKERVERQKQHRDILVQAIEQMEAQMELLKSSCSRAEQLSVLYTNVLTDICNVEERVAGGIETEAAQVLKNTPTLVDNCKALETIPSHIQSICSTEERVYRTEEEADMLHSAVVQRGDAWQQVTEEMKIFRENADSAQDKAKKMGEQASLQVRETEKFLQTVVPQELETQMTQLSKDMKQAAGKLKEYAAGIEEQSHLPLLLWQEWVGLGLLGAAVVAKLVFICL